MSYFLFKMAEKQGLMEKEDLGKIGCFSMVAAAIMLILAAILGDVG